MEPAYHTETDDMVEGAPCQSDGRQGREGPWRQPSTWWARAHWTKRDNRKVDEVPSRRMADAAWTPTRSSLESKGAVYMDRRETRRSRALEVASRPSTGDSGCRLPAPCGRERDRGMAGCLTRRLRGRRGCQGTGAGCGRWRGCCGRGHRWGRGHGGRERWCCTWTTRDHMSSPYGHMDAYAHV